MAKTSTYWDKRAIKRLTNAEKHSDVYINRVKKVYEQAYKDIDRQLASIYRNYSNETGLDTQKLKELLTRSETKKTWEQMKRQGLDKYIKDNYKSRISRLEQLKAQIYAKAKEIYPKEELEDTMCYKGVINQNYYKTMYDIQMGTGYDFDFATIDNNMITRLLQEPWSGKNYSERIWTNTDILADNLSEILGGAMLSGQSIELTAKQIRDRFNVSKYYAERLIRTETNHFNNEVDAMAYEELGLDKYVFVATLDNRTSDICQAMDNKVFKYSERVEGINYPPLHPNCRSTTRGYLGKEEEKALQRRARNPITGKTETVDNMSYSEWIKQYQNVENNKKTVKIVEKTPQNNNKSSKNVKNDDKNNKNIVKNVEKALTKDQKNALEYYVSGEGMYINNYLRSRAGVTPSDMNDIDKKLLKELDSATNNIVNDKILYRSVDASVIFPNIDTFGYDDLQEYLAYGNNQKIIADRVEPMINNSVKEFVDKGFVSTTKDYDIAKNWDDFTGSDKPIVLELTVDKSVKGVDLNFLDIADDPQKETLLARNQVFTVENIGSKDGQIYVKVKVKNK